MADDEQKRVQLVVQRPNTTRSPFIGFGLLASLVIGFDQLGNAARGIGSFEAAIGRFLLIMVACAIAGAVLGRLVDSATSNQTLESRTNLPMSESGNKQPTADQASAQAAQESQ